MLLKSGGNAEEVWDVIVQLVLRMAHTRTHRRSTVRSCHNKKKALKCVTSGLGTINNNTATCIYAATALIKTNTVRVVRHTLNQGWMYVTGNGNTKVTRFANECVTTLFLAVAQSGVVSPIRSTETISYMSERLPNRTSPLW